MCVSRRVPSCKIGKTLSRKFKVSFSILVYSERLRLVVTRSLIYLEITRSDEPYGASNNPMTKYWFLTLIVRYKYTQTSLYWRIGKLFLVGYWPLGISAEREAYTLKLLASTYEWRLAKLDSRGASSISSKWLSSFKTLLHVLILDRSISDGDFVQ